MTTDALTIGIEEEYLLVDRDSYDLAEAPPGLMEACKAKLEGQVSPEFLQCQIEIGTRVCASIPEAREDLKRLRACVSEEAARFGLTPIAVSCHPFADWKGPDPYRQGPLQRLGPRSGRRGAADADLRDACACRPAR